MATFAMIHGAGDAGWYWHLVERELRQRGHESVAPDLPVEDDSAGLPEYARTVVAALGDRDDVIVVAQSFGGFTAPLVAEQVPVRMLVLVAAMIPAPGEAPGDWTANTGFDQVMRAQTVQQTVQQTTGQQTTVQQTAVQQTTVQQTAVQQTAGEDVFYHDVPPGLAAQARRRSRRQSDTPGRDPWPLGEWPDVPTRLIVCTEDRFFPPGFMRRVAAERLGLTPDEIAAGHCVALSRPKELADMLAGYAAA